MASNDPIDTALGYAGTGANVVGGALAAAETILAAMNLATQNAEYASAKSVDDGQLGGCGCDCERCQRGALGKAGLATGTGG